VNVIVALPYVGTTNEPVPAFVKNVPDTLSYNPHSKTDTWLVICSFITPLIRGLT